MIKAKAEAKEKAVAEEEYFKIKLGNGGFVET